MRFVVFGLGLCLGLILGFSWGKSAYIGHPMDAADLPFNAKAYAYSEQLPFQLAAIPTGPRSSRIVLVYDFDGRLRKR